MKDTERTHFAIGYDTAGYGAAVLRSPERPAFLPRGVTLYAAAIALLALGAPGCATFLPLSMTGEQDSAREISNVDGRKADGGVKAKAKAKPAEKAGLAKQTRPRVGDFYVHRFSGSFRKSPVLLTEEVTALDGDVAVIDFTLVDGDLSYTLRVRRHIDTGVVDKVSELDGDQERAAPLEAYDALIAKTTFAPDINDALLEESNQTCLVGPDELECQVNKYRVFVGDHEATLSVTQSGSLPGRDIAGEVVGVDGQVIYRAELVERGIGDDLKHPEVADAR